ncbi:carotenoid oxygenase [Lophiotrema nucula]|uniref:Carotenoid oxygenase n=1 Tax=Lophiotrema nucula TaxID=690887 RepID=A0A6A5YGX9_9PLEO|nr:carotenoid oxygenase [Lophiotrema nucula]
MSNTSRKRKRGAEHPYLTGNFAPVTTTHTPTPCAYTGNIPPELLGGEYVRNGGNPVSNADLGRDAHWFDGDGMLAGVLFQRSTMRQNDAVPHFVNQYILTDLYISSSENDSSLRTPILPSIATLVNPVLSIFYILLRIVRSVFLVLLSHLAGSQQAIKRISVANTSILFHDGRALATCESGPPIRVQLPGLETVGWYDGKTAEGEVMDVAQHDSKEEVFGGSGLFSFMKEWTTGHPKVDPKTGEMVLFHCTFAKPFIHYSVIPRAQGPETTRTGSRLLNAPVPGCSGGKMMHDFGVSLKHTVIMDLPLSLTPFNLLKNQPVVSYDEDKSSRFGVFPRQDPSKVRWYETKGCCIFHTANTWDEVDDAGRPIAVKMLACRLTSASLVYSAGNLTPPKKRKDSDIQRPMSFFAKYDEDNECIDVERTPSDEKTALLWNEHNSVLDMQSASLPPISEDDDEQCRVYYYRFDLASSAPLISHQYALAAIPFEFPTVNPAKEMSFARYIYGCSTSNETFGAALGKATKIDVLLKIDAQSLLAQGEHEPPASVTGCVDRRSMSQILASQDANDPIRAFKMPKQWFAQEARFVSRDHPISEDDGYLLFYAFDEGQLDEYGECSTDAVSELWVLDARNMMDVVVRVKLPQRVPYGLHGNWFSEGQIQGQRAVEAVRKMPNLDSKRTTWGTVKGGIIRALG